MHFFFFNISLAYTFQTVSVGRRKFSANFQLAFRLIKGLIFVTFISILVILIVIPHMTPRDIVVCILAFLPTGWGLLLVSYQLTSILIVLLQRTLFINSNVLVHNLNMSTHSIDCTSMQAGCSESRILGFGPNTCTWL